MVFRTRTRKGTAGIKYIDFENVAEFVLTQPRDPLVKV